MATRGARQVERVRASMHEGFLRHRNYMWLKFASVFCIVAVIIYALHDPIPRPSGGSWYGYTLGTIGALLIVWLAMLGVRKRAMTSGHWSLKSWTSAHVYLGLTLITIGTLHTGFQFGLNVHTLAYVLMLIVIFSGMYGIGVYAMLPDELSTNRSEMTKAQMIDAVTKLDRQLQIAAQPLGVEDTEIILRSLREDPFRAGAWARVRGSERNCHNAHALRLMRERLANASDAEKPALQSVAQLMERKAAALTRIRQQLRLRAMLELWLFIHVPFTFALIAALIVHIVSVFFYW